MCPLPGKVVIVPIPGPDGSGSFCFGLRPKRELRAVRLIPFCLMTYASVLSTFLAKCTWLFDSAMLRAASVGETRLHVLRNCLQAVLEAD